MFVSENLALFDKASWQNIALYIGLYGGLIRTTIKKIAMNCKEKNGRKCMGKLMALSKTPSVTLKDFQTSNYR
jgi:hypothetical protein